MQLNYSPLQLSEEKTQLACGHIAIQFYSDKMQSTAKRNLLASVKDTETFMLQEWKGKDGWAIIASRYRNLQNDMESR